MTSDELTDEQRAAVESPERTLVVHASAGTGKTRVLVERYLRHVQVDGISPDEILTITYTRKAAAELKTRIVGRLRRAGLAHEAQSAETGPIQTIHGFCERILRENSVAAGLDPDFEILEGSAVSRLFNQALAMALSRSMEEAPCVSRLLTELAGQRAFDALGSPHSKLTRAVHDVIEKLRGSGLSPEDLLHRHGDPEQLRDTWQELLASDLPEDVRDHFADQHGSFSERVFAAYKAARKRPPTWCRHSTEESDSDCAAHAVGLVQLAARTWRELEKAMAESHALDFTALEARAVALVGDSQQVQDRIASQYRVLLVDETQDVNPVQYNLLDKLTIPLRMYVGDPQQSIYAFRHADSRLFLDLSARHPSIALTKNWRCAEPIQRFVDALFGGLMESYRPMLPGEDIATAGEEIELWLHEYKDSVRQAEQVAELLSQMKAEGMSESDLAVLVRQGRHGIALLSHLERMGIPARIAGGTEKFYAKLEIRDLANALRALADPHDDFSLLALLRSPMCGLSLDSIVALGMKRPVIESLYKEALPVDRDRELLARFRVWFEPLAEYADRLPAWEALSEVLSKSPLLETLAKRRNAAQLIANVRKLIMLAAAEPELGPVEYAAQIDEIQLLRHAEGDAPAADEDQQAVTIMTIHKAKGLEFPVVLVPETHTDPGGRSRDVETDTALGLVTVKLGGSPSIFHSWMEGRRRELDRLEGHRTLYVAMTRAQKRLCFVAHPRAKDTTVASLICRTLGFKSPSEPPPLGIRLRE